ncbi:hypothetical protein [Moorena producens]|uniref:hypothetical protein n=1 Tax=Moorena producens TaxID=1155739 RepID=UPI000A67FE8F|nr:hypothetical protein [Moorena producens]
MQRGLGGFPHERLHRFLIPHTPHPTPHTPHLTSLLKTYPCEEMGRPAFAQVDRSEIYSVSSTYEV